MKIQNHAGAVVPMSGSELPSLCAPDCEKTHLVMESNCYASSKTMHVEKSEKEWIYFSKKGGKRKNSFMYGGREKQLRKKETGFVAFNFKECTKR